MMLVTGRKLNIAGSDKIVGHMGDNLVESRMFSLPRIYEGIDMAPFDFKLDTQAGDVKNIIDLDKSVTEDKITLTWTIAESHILRSGRMAIQIRAFKGTVEKWHSSQEFVIVHSSINPTAAQPDVLPSEFEQMEVRVTSMKNDAEGAADTAETQANRAQGIADVLEVTTIPAAITAIEDVGQAKVDLAKAEADRAQELADTFEQTTLPAAITAVEAAGQAKVDEAKAEANRAEEAADIVRAMSVEEGQNWEGVSA